MPVGFGVSTETARSVVKNFKKHRKYAPMKGETMILLPNGKKTTKSQVQIPDKETLLSVNGTGQIWTKDDPNQKILFKMNLENGKVERKTIPFTRKKNPFKESILLVIFGNYLVEAYKEFESEMYNFHVSICVGDSFTWHAEGIKQNIIEKFDEDTYREWKEVVRKTRWQAKMCVDLARGLTNKIIASEVCFESSKRFCKQIGLFLSGHEAFLLPEKYQY